MIYGLPASFSGVSKGVSYFEKGKVERFLGKQPIVGETVGYPYKRVNVFTEISSYSINANVVLNKKLSALEGAQNSAVAIRYLPDGRIRYYDAERLAKK